MKAIISPYERTERNGETVYMPCVVIDTKATEFTSSDLPAEMLDEDNAERLIIISPEKHAEAVALGYVEVEVDSWLS